jgi:hypothetical protein
MPFHVKPFEKKFLKKRFAPQISSKPSSPQESLQIKEEVNILRGEKHFNIKNPF